jgi:hypothetical protein
VEGQLENVQMTSSYSLPSGIPGACPPTPEPPTEAPTDAPTSICDQKAGQADCGNICAYSNCPSFNRHKKICEISTKPGEVADPDPCTPTDEGQLAILELEIGEICGIVLLAVCIAALLIRYCRNTRSTSLTPAAAEGAALSKAPVLDGI